MTKAQQQKLAKHYVIRLNDYAAKSRELGLSLQEAYDYSAMRIKAVTWCKKSGLSFTRFHYHVAIERSKRI